MTQIEITTVKRAIALLASLTDEPRASTAVIRRGPVTQFVRDYLVNDPAADVSCGELWTFYQEIVGARELPAIRRAAFLRQLPGVLEHVFNARKSHNVLRAGRRVRGFRGAGIKVDASPVTKLMLDPE